MCQVFQLEQSIHFGSLLLASMFVFCCCLVSFWGYSAKVLRSYELEYVFGGFLKDFEKLEKREREYHVIVKSTSFPIGYSEKVQHFEKLPKVDLLEEQS